jgi:hypothetical protein
MIKKITQAYIWHYSDNKQTIAYVEWINNKGANGRTGGDPNSPHMQALLSRAEREGIPTTCEVW